MFSNVFNTALKTFNNDLASLSIFSICAIVMVFLFVLPSRHSHRQTILTIGVLGTFIGIAWGLLNFDFKPGEIEKSIENLLAGLKTAFFTSIWGMFLVVIINLFAKGKRTGNAPLDLVVQAIELSSDKICKEIGQMINRNVQEIKNLHDTTKTSSHETVQSIRETSQENQNNLIEGFREINSSLSKVVKEISKGASDTIIQALEQTLQTFNESLKKHFGDNFNKLNEACSQMIQWQEQYKGQVGEATEHLRFVGETLSGQSEIHEMMRSNIKESNMLLERVEKHIEVMNKLLKDHEGLPDRVSNTISSVKEEFEDISEKMGEFSKTIQDGLKTQSQSITNMTQNLEQSLNDMNGTLTALTNGFADKYNEFLKIISENSRRS